MSTRSNIARFDSETGRVMSVYCHCDGYPKGVGEILRKHYTTDDAVTELVALGNLSVLGARIAPPLGATHSFAAPLDDVTIAYARDRGDDWTEEKPTDHYSVTNWLADSLANTFYEHIYLFRDSGWSHIDANAMRRTLVALIPPPMSAA